MWGVSPVEAVARELVDFEQLLLSPPAHPMFRCVTNFTFTLDGNHRRAALAELEDDEDA